MVQIFLCSIVKPISTLLSVSQAQHSAIHGLDTAQLEQLGVSVCTASLRAGQYVSVACNACRTRLAVSVLQTAVSQCFCCAIVPANNDNLRPLPAPAIDTVFCAGANGESQLN